MQCMNCYHKVFSDLTELEKIRENMLVNETLTLDEIMTLFNIYFEHANRPEIVADSEACQN